MTYATTLVTKIDNIRYSDANINISETNTDTLVTDDASVANSITTILSTPRGSRVFNREFGSVVDDILFDPIDEFTELRIKREVIDALDIWEPRIQLNTATVLADTANQQYYVELNYTIPTLNDKNVTLKFNLFKG